MENIFSLLNLNANLLSNFSTQAKLIKDTGTERILHQNEKRLKEIEHDHDSEGNIKTPLHSIDAVVQKILRIALQDSVEDVTLPELRIISYNLSQLHGADGAYSYAIKLLNDNWNSVFFNGIAYYLLSSWNDIREDYLTECSDLFVSKLQSYSGEILRYIKLKQNIDFFKNGGPLRLGSLIARKGITPHEAPYIIGYKQSAFSHSFFSDVIVKYVKDTKLDDIDFLKTKIFSCHTLNRTKKLVFAELILDAENSGANTVRQQKISSMANNILGDISLSATWAPFNGATKEDIEKLKRASELANIWINRLVIKAFFEVCVRDNDRKRFWMGYAKDVTSFKIAGSSLIKQALKKDPRIDFQTLNKSFIETNSYPSTNSALILVFGRKALVEFSDVGAVYAYKVTNRLISPILKGKRFIDKTDDLKDTSLPLLVENQGYYSYHYDEGRLTHRGEWETRLHGWLKNKVFTVSNKTSNIYESDSVFKHKPILYTPPLIKGEAKKARPSNNEIQIDTISATSATSIWSSLDSPTRIFSKWLFDDACRVVGTAGGFYLQIATAQGFRYAKISQLAGVPTTNGSIWIKKPQSKDWHPIVYSLNNKEYNLGLIKFSKERVLYRVSNERPDCKIFPTA